MKIHMSKRRLGRVVNLVKFPNLKTIWLNQNRLHTVKFLSVCRNLKELYLDHNFLGSQAYFFCLFGTLKSRYFVVSHWAKCDLK